jgi:hypothetical protein
MCSAGCCWVATVFFSFSVYVLRATILSLCAAPLGLRQVVLL